jgi:hypothetical protein
MFMALFIVNGPIWYFYLFSFVRFQNHELNMLFLFLVSIRFYNHEFKVSSYLLLVLNFETLNLDKFSYIWHLSNFGTLNWNQSSYIWPLLDLGTLNLGQFSYFCLCYIRWNFKLKWIFLYFAFVKFYNHEPTWFSYVLLLSDFGIMNLDESFYIWPLSDLGTLNWDQSSYVLPLLNKWNFKLRSIFLYFASTTFYNHEPTWPSYVLPLSNFRNMRLDESSYILLLLDSITMKLCVLLSFCLCPICKTIWIGMVL